MMMVGPGEADRYLGVAFDHLRTFCNLIVIRVEGERPHYSYDQRFRFLEAEVGSFYEHEGTARQELLDFTVAHAPEYVLAIDADEFVEDPPALLAALDRRPDYVRLCMMEVWSATEDRLLFRQDGGWRPHEAPLVFQPSPGLRIADKQLASGRIPLNAIGRRAAGTTACGIFHFGWACEADRQARYDRYVEHDGGKFHASAHLLSIMWANNDPRLRLCRDPWPLSLEPLKDRIVGRASRG